MAVPSQTNRRLQRALLRFALAVLPLALVLPHTLGWVQYGFVDRVEHYLYDLRVRLTMPGGVDKRVVIVDIDERSLQAEGQWPWKRTRLASLLDRLFDDYGVRVVGWDVYFPEAEEATGLTVLRELQARRPADPALSKWVAERQPALEGDARFAEALVARDVVLGYVFKPEAALRGESAARGALPAAVNVQGARVATVPWVTAAGYTANLESMQQNAVAGGFFDTPLVDEDGVVRRMPLLQQYRGQLYESLALAVARVAQGNAPLQLGFRGRAEAPERLDYLQLGARRVPVDSQAAVLTPFRGPAGSYPYVSATDVLHGKADTAVLRDAIVLVGTSAPGLLDIRSTPVGNQYIGVEAHANVVAGLLAAGLPVVGEPPQRVWIELATLVLLALLMALLVPRLPPALAFAAIMLAALLLAAANLAAWHWLHWVLPLAGSFIYMAAAAFLLLNYAYFVESRRKRQIQGIFSQYVPADYVAQLDPDDARLSLEGESREMSVLFSDVRGFTTLSEGLSPRELTQVMNELLTPVTAVIQQHRGTVDKYMGDAVMAFWGAPLRDVDHAKHAVLAALGMVRAVARVREEFQARGWPAVAVGVGVSSGTMNVGNMGSQFRMAYTVLGDAVNLGSRLEGLTKQYGVDILISAATVEAIGKDVACREVDRVRVKGKTEPVAIFEPLGLMTEISVAQMDRAQRFGEFLQLYRSQQFEAASERLLQLEQEQPEKLFAVYRERLERFVASPPPADWDGVFNFETK